MSPAKSQAILKTKIEQSSSEEQTVLLDTSASSIPADLITIEQALQIFSLQNIDLDSTPRRNVSLYERPVNHEINLDMTLKISENIKYTLEVRKYLSLNGLDEDTINQEVTQDFIKSCIDNGLSAQEAAEIILF